MLKAYLDDSGTHNGSPAVVVGGLVGRIDEWVSFDACWQSRLASPLLNKPPLRAFSLGDCVKYRQPFKDHGYTRDECEALRGIFREMIINSGFHHRAWAITPADWDEIVVPPYRNYMGTAEEACFFAFIDGIIEDVRGLDVGERQIEFIYDKGRSNRRIKRLAELFRKGKDRYPEIQSIRFEAVAGYPGLQAADTIATENFWAVQEFLVHGDLSRATPQFRALSEQMPAVGMLLDREAIAAEVARRGRDGRLVGPEQQQSVVQPIGIQ